MLFPAARKDAAAALASPGSATTPAWMLFLRALALLLLCLAASPALPHTAGTIGFATVTAEGSRVRYDLVLGLPSIPAPLAQAWGLQGAGEADYARVQQQVSQHFGVAVEAGACRAEPSPSASRKGENLLVTLLFACPAAPEVLVLRDDLADLLGPDYHTLANIRWQDGTAQFMFQPDRREARIALRSAGPQGWTSFFTLGVEHILIGFDHLLFLLALILRGGNAWSLLKIVTAFTIAHSITLALAALNVIVLPSRLVEGAIALSIAYVAAENLFAKRPTSHRWAVSFVFGLVHGVGFSSVLREIGLPQDGLVWALLGFNLGVEAGQAIAVLAALPLLLYLRRTKYEARTVATVSAIVLVVGLALFVDRALLGTA
jgi:hydrogenase/urease accessory protein HupE